MGKQVPVVKTGLALYFSILTSEQHPTLPMDRVLIVIINKGLYYTAQNVAVFSIDF